MGTSYATWCGTMVKSGENLREVVGSIPDDWTFARQPDDVCGKSGKSGETGETEKQKNMSEYERTQRHEEDKENP